MSKSPVLGRELRSARDAADLTQAELAAVLGVSLRTLVGWENGEVVPRAKHRRAIRAWLDRQEVAA